MRIARKISTVALLLIFCMAVLVPCSPGCLPNATPIHACCHGMKMPCAPGSGSCCKSAPQSAQAAALDAKSVELRQPVMVAMTTAAAAPLYSTVAASEWVNQGKHPPPLSPPDIISNLRV
jgi:hypothetical protein